MQPLGVDEPTVVGPYRLLGRLGSGGMGRVYLGRSAGGRTVAVKIVHPHFALDEEFRARFRREVEAARRVGGAWTAPVLDADPEASVPWVATGYAAGPSLAAAVADAGGPLPAHSVRVLGAGLAEALTAVHALGLVHRDVKPSNVLLTLDGPLLIDFGIARATDGTASLTSTGVSVGSPGYMSPEQILGKGVTGAADVFSLGAVLVYAATGESPFPGDSSAALLYKVVHEEPRLGSLDGELRELVAACLAKDPAVRPAPGEVAGRLAPEGAARLVTAGWLPGPLVEQVSRSAVHLLNLEAAEVTPSGPVGFSSPSVGTDSGAGTPPPDGVFGPPPTMPPYAMPTYVPGRRDVQDAVAAPTVHPSAPAADPGHQDHQDRREHREDHPGKLSVSMAATSAPGANGRGRRVSCTLALAVAGALAAVTVGSVFMFHLLPGGGDDNSASSGSDSAASPPAATPSAAGSDGATLASVPAHYLGTWSGDAYALNGKLPAGTFRVILHQAAVGKELGTFRSTDLIGGICDDVLVLKKVTDKQLTATSIAKTSNPGTCTTGSHEVRLIPAGGDLKYETDNADAGDPVARMSKAE
ncbi:serine/threonine-protein kinase [Streptomyces mirabilis]|uniref:Serine/threonine protein kinase n=1 Tax=Streptomyces mirabilis TaxID=68239 RepID=A0A1I2ISS9_9ACTN|nr:serine/threonine-protein kinase [Streptomyces mirabilis]SFF43581.1 serine/threonine protein kinase [Streptomyces mirabilis]